MVKDSVSLNIVVWDSANHDPQIFEVGERYEKARVQQNFLEVQQAINDFVAIIDQKYPLEQPKEREQRKQMVHLSAGLLSWEETVSTIEAFHDEEAKKDNLYEQIKKKLGLITLAISAAEYQFAEQGIDTLNQMITSITPQELGSFLPSTINISPEMVILSFQEAANSFTEVIKSSALRST